MSLIDLFKEFHSRAIVYAYPLSVRALFDTILYDFNAAFWPEERVYSERELSRLTGLSAGTIHRALKFLSDRGHIKTHSTKRGTVVKLLEHPRSTDEAPVEHPRSTREAVGGSSTIRAREDVKTSDFKTLREPESRARARAAAPVNESVFDTWANEMHRPLGASERYELADLEEEFGTEKIKAAIVATRQKFHWATFANFKTVLKGDNHRAKSGNTGNSSVNATSGERISELGLMEIPDWARGATLAGTDAGTL